MDNNNDIIVLYKNNKIFNLTALSMMKAITSNRKILTELYNILKQNDYGEKYPKIKLERILMPRLINTTNILKAKYAIKNIINHVYNTNHTRIDLKITRKELEDIIMKTENIYINYIININNDNDKNKNIFDIKINKMNIKIINKVKYIILKNFIRKLIESNKLKMKYITQIESIDMLIEKITENYTIQVALSTIINCHTTIDSFVQIINIEESIKPYIENIINKIIYNNNNVNENNIEEIMNNITSKAWEETKNEVQKFIELGGTLPF